MNAPPAGNRKSNVQKRWVIWFCVLVGLIAVGEGGGALLRAQGAGAIAAMVRGVGDGAAFIWILWGLWTQRRHRIAKQALAILLTGVAAGIITLLSLRYQRDAIAIGVLGVWAMASLFMVGLWLIRAAMAPGHPITGVARTLIDEAIRMKVAVILLVGLALLVPILPLVLDPAERLQYRMQFFLTWSVGGVNLLLSLLTVFLACGTICSEINQRQIFMTLTKPVSRGQYLLGKWLGISLLNLLLLSIAGGGIYVMAKMLQQQPTDPIDRFAVDEQVMVARQAVGPRPPAFLDLGESLREHIEQLRREDPVRYGEGGELDPRDRKTAETAIMVKWHTIGPNDEQAYLFKDLDKARDFGESVQLRLKPKFSQKPPDEMVRLGLWLNGRPFPVDQEGRHLPLVIADNRFHVVDLPLRAVNDRGELEIRIKNVDLRDPSQTHPSSVTFAPGTDFELLYKVGRFEPNFFRSLVIVWMRLVFLGILGLLAGTFLGFPVACLLTMLIYVFALASGYLIESLGYYASLPWRDLPFDQMMGRLIADIGGSISEGKFANAVKLVIRILGELVMALIPSFSEYNPTPSLADGRLVSPGLMGRAVLWLGVVWGGGCACVAWLIFRHRELARVTV